MEGDWFYEKNEQWEGYSVGLKVEKVLFEGKSQYQDILVFKSTTFGNVLVLDGCIQCTERDECSYQEMIAHLPLFAHPEPRNVLVVGGGDGGVVREVLRHKEVEKVTLCEIDEKVIEVCKQYLPNMANSLEDPRCEVHIGDGVEYMKQHKNCFDVIITDAPDPIGAAKGLYELDYYRCLKNALKDSGILCSQGENIWLDLDIADNLLKCCRNLFPNTAYAVASMPTYASGQIGFVMASNSPDIKLHNPCRVLIPSEIEKLGLKYYSTYMHKAAFVLPNFAKKVLLKDGDGQIHAPDT